MDEFEIVIDKVVKVKEFARKKSGTTGQQIFVELPTNDEYTTTLECVDVEEGGHFKELLQKGHKYNVKAVPYYRFENIKLFNGNMRYVNIPSYIVTHIIDCVD